MPATVWTPDMTSAIEVPTITGERSGSPVMWSMPL
ncbi:unannotated protein [freshwater metagenome]|uniref:Unannotated protein n=1 Tax=freshwater metagenome TaxID=449393 RepID=A0A6J6WWN7_9ZZZZ